MAFCVCLVPSSSVLNVAAKMVLLKCKSYLTSPLNKTLCSFRSCSTGHPLVNKVSTIRPSHLTDLTSNYSFCLPCTNHTEILAVLNTPDTLPPWGLCTCCSQISACLYPLPLQVFAPSSLLSESSLTIQILNCKPFIHGCTFLPIFNFILIELHCHLECTYYAF